MLEKLIKRIRTGAENSRKMREIEKRVELGEGIKLEDGIGQMVVVRRDSQGNLVKVINKIAVN